MQSSPSFWKPKVVFLDQIISKKYCTKNSEMLAQKSRKKFVKNVFAVWLENALNTLFPELFWDRVLKYFPKWNHFKIYVRLRLSQWHINKNENKTYIKARLLLNRPDILQKDNLLMQTLYRTDLLSCSGFLNHLILRTCSWTRLIKHLQSILNNIWNLFEQHTQI